MTTPTSMSKTSTRLQQAVSSLTRTTLGTDAAVGTDQQKALLAWTMSKYSSMRSNQVRVKRQWYLNMAFYMGNQNVAFYKTATSTNGYSLQVPPAPPWRVRLVINKIRPIVRTEIAKLVAQKPRFVVVPASTDDDDLMAARAAEDIFDSIYQTKRIQRTLRRSLWWNVLCGTSYLKCYWNSEAYDTDSEENGDFEIEPVTPFHLFVPDLAQEDIEKQPYVFHVSTKSVQDCQAMWPDLPNPVVPNISAEDDLLNSSALGIPGGTQTEKDRVLCIEVWIKPKGHPMFPDGGFYTVVGDQLAPISKEYPYKHGQYPFIKFEHVPMGRFYGESVVTDLIQLQREFNRTRSQIVESKNRMSKPQLMAPKGSIDPSKMTSEPGQVIMYTPGLNKPEPIPLQALPSYVFDSINLLSQDMDDISGQHDISRGQNPSQVTAASALSFLQEQDDTMLSDTIESVEEGVEKLGHQILELAAQFWDQERVIKIVGKDSTYDAQVFTGESLNGNTDLRVEAGSALPTSKAAKQAFIMDLIKMGVIAPQDGLQVLDVGGIDRVYEDYLVDIRQAQRENLRMSSGETNLTQPGTPPQLGPQNPPDPLTGQLVPPQVIAPATPATQVFATNTWDNHAVHITTHNKFRKGQEFETLPDEVKAIFESHVQSHIDQLKAQQASGLQVGAPLDSSQSNLPDFNATLPPPQPVMPPQQPGQQFSGPPPVGQMSPPVGTVPNGAM